MTGYPKNITLPTLDIARSKPRNYLEWKTLRRWEQLPDGEMSVPGYLLKLAREEAELTQKELASLLGASQQAIAQAERWQSNPTVLFMRSWLKACGRKLELDYS